MDCLKVMKILNVYRQASGQEVNVDKFGIKFGKNTRERDKILAKEVLGV